MITILARALDAEWEERGVLLSGYHFPAVVVAVSLFLFMFLLSFGGRDEHGLFTMLICYTKVFPSFNAF